MHLGQGQEIMWTHVPPSPRTPAPPQVGQVSCRHSDPVIVSVALPVGGHVVVLVVLVGVVFIEWTAGLVP